MGDGRKIYERQSGGAMFWFGGIGTGSGGWILNDELVNSPAYRFATPGDVYSR